jgi:hypothetical protein
MKNLFRFLPLVLMAALPFLSHAQTTVFVLDMNTVPPTQLGAIQAIQGTESAVGDYNFVTSPAPAGEPYGVATEYRRLNTWIHEFEDELHFGAIFNIRRTGTDFRCGSGSEPLERPQVELTANFDTDSAPTVLLRDDNPGSPADEYPITGVGPWTFDGFWTFCVDATDGVVIGPITGDSWSIDVALSQEDLGLDPVTDAEPFIISWLVANGDGVQPDIELEVPSTAPMVYRLTVADEDGDGISDLADNCSLAANADQSDNESDGIGDVCDDDDDNDGVPDGVDNCTLTANADQVDLDGDGVGDFCDDCISSPIILTVADVPPTPTPASIDVEAEVVTTCEARVTFTVNDGPEELMETPPEGRPFAVGIDAEYPGLAEICFQADVVGDRWPTIEECVLIPIYDPSAGFVTGGGWIWSPDDAIPPAIVKDQVVDGSWFFNAEPPYVTPAEFSTDESAIGLGSLHVLPITNDGDNNAKFILRYVPSVPIELADLDAFSIDFLIDELGTLFNASQFYVNLYTLTPDPTDGGWYDCRFDYVAGSGSTTDWTSLGFDASTPATAVGDKLGGACPTSYDGMPVGSNVLFLAVNLGDTSGNDTGIGGYFDNAVLSIAGSPLVWDFGEVPTGKASFGFVSKYKKGASTPTGVTQFYFEAGNLEFHSDVQEWLVVNQNGANAQFKGEGFVNDVTPARFMLWAGDGDATSDEDDFDTFRIRIWEEVGEEEVVIYDNGTDQAIAGGSIVIHTGGKGKAGKDGFPDVPVEFALGQNYPNPFNPATQLAFDLPEAANVRLAVFDVLGRQVALLADGGYEAGTHEVTWDASSMPSGVYLYRIEAGAYSATKRMMLLK